MQPDSALRRLCLLLLLAPAALAGDWTNAGGDAGRNGQSPEVGPAALPAPAWSGSRSSIIAWQPVTAGRRVFMVRQTGFVPGGVPNESPVVCQDLDTGAELWAFNTPFEAGDWTTWVAGTSRGLVYCSRAGNGASSSAPLYALHQDTGAVAWVSEQEIRTGAYDGVVFAPDGDPLVAWHLKLRRIDADTGATVWTADRTGSVSGNCGVALHGDTVYSLEVVPGGHAVRAFDLATGAVRYTGPTMPGFTVQNTPMVAPDGTIYVSRTQNNAAVDFFYSFSDTGAAIVQNWSVAAGWTTSSELAVGLDGSPYMIGPGKVVQRLDQATGAVTATSVPIATGTGNLTPRLAVDAAGRVYAGNGGFADGRVWCFTADLDLLWSVAVANLNIGGPVLAQDGTLLVAGTGTDVRAWRSGLPWADVQQGLAGGALLPPELAGEGTLVPGTPAALALAEAAPGAGAWLVVGASQLGAPFKGGTLVPAAQLLLGPLVTDGEGGLTLGGPWPAGLPSGASLWLQAWVPDPAGPAGWAASNGLRATAP